MLQSIKHMASSLEIESQVNALTPSALNPRPSSNSKQGEHDVWFGFRCQAYHACLLHNKGSIALETKIHGNLGEEGDIAAIWDIFRKICWEVWDLG